MWYPERYDMEGTEVDAERNAVLNLERKSVQPYRTQDEYLYAMKEDLAEWFNTLYTTNVSVDDFFEYLETGVILCQHANKVNGTIVELIQNGFDTINGNLDTLELAKQMIQYRPSVKPGSFQCRDNISNYIGWCRRTLGIPDTLLFESDDLVMRKNERNVVLCVLEVARRGARYGMLAPVLVQLEEEIDAEIAGEEPPPRPQRQRPRITIDMMSLDEMVREIAKQCSCPDTFPIIRVSEGKYKVGESLTLIFVRILRNHVMVRIGGGWDTLENYLNRHDPCRCQADKGQHRTRRFSQSSAKRRATMTSTTPTSDVTKGERQLSTTPTSPTSTKSCDGSSSRSQVVRRLERVRLSDDLQQRQQRPQSAKTSVSRPQSQSIPKRAHSPSTQTRRPQSPLPSRRISSPANTPERIVQVSTNRRSSLTIEKTCHDCTGTETNKVISKPETVRPQTRRPASAAPTAPQNVRSTTMRKSEVTKPQPRRPSSASSNVHSRILIRDEQTERTRSRDAPVASRHVRSRSVGADERCKNLITVNTSESDHMNDVLLITRDKTGKHIISKTEDTDTMNATMPMRKGNGSKNGVGNGERRLNSTRVNISRDKLFPSKPKTIMRSQSVETKLLADHVNSVSDSLVSISMDNTPDGTVIRRQRSVESAGAPCSVSDLACIPAPIGDHKLNKEMEKLFEEYRRAEKGWFHYDDADEEVDMLTASTSSVKPDPGSGSASKSKRPQSAGPQRNTAPSTPRGATSLGTNGRNTPTSSRKSSISESTSSLSSISSAGGRTRPMTPTPQRRPYMPITPYRSVTPTPGVSSRVASSNDVNTSCHHSMSNKPEQDSVSTSDRVSISSNVKNRETSRPRSQTLNPTPTAPQIKVQSRCRTPIIQANIEGAKPRIDTGLRKRSTTPLSVSNTDIKVPQQAVHRSTSLSRVAINKTISGARVDDTGVSMKRYRSNEDIWDCNTTERRSRFDVERKRVNVTKGHTSVSRELASGSRGLRRASGISAANLDIQGQSQPLREPPRSLPPTPGMLNTALLPEPVTVEIPDNTKFITRMDSPEGAYAARPRKDTCIGPKTRIPRPSNAQSPTPEAGSLKRFDSGVDINISPTESSSIQDDDDMYLPWQQSEHITLAGQSLGYSVANVSDEYY